MSHVEIIKGNAPVVLGFPHTGTHIPDAVAAALNENGRALADTDWRVHRLYEGLLEEATKVRTKIHRYVIDANRNPEGQSLYPGANTTSLCPVTDFDGAPIYSANMEPDAGEIKKRCDAFHRPYHDALQAELERVHGIFGFAILFDCHSIRSEIGFLFDGRLPDFNIGTNSGASCHPQIEALTCAICQNADGYSDVLNGRFKGGWTTRHYGKPEQGFHSVQLELAQSTYMRENPPWAYQDKKARRLRVHLKNILATLSNWRPS